MTSDILPINQIKILTDKGHYIDAEKYLLKYDFHSAEWNYIYSIILQKKGWFDSSLRYIKEALKLEPNNKLYSETLEVLESRCNNYRKNYYRTTRCHNNSSCCCDCCDCCDCDDCDCCIKLYCADSCCECIGGDLISCC